MYWKWSIFLVFILLGTLSSFAHAEESIIEMVVTDLSEQLAIPVDDIHVSSAIPVTWPDPTLGCPDDTIGVAMVLVKGWRIILKAEGDIYYYHTNDGAHFVQCPTHIASQSTSYWPIPLSVQFSQTETMMDDLTVPFVHLLVVLVGTVTLFTVLSYREQK